MRDGSFLPAGLRTLSTMCRLNVQPQHSEDSTVQDLSWGLELGDLNMSQVCPGGQEANGTRAVAGIVWQQEQGRDSSPLLGPHL